jgi:hypothetical protein
MSNPTSDEPRRKLSEAQTEIEALRSDVAWLGRLTARFIYNHLFVYACARLTGSGRKLHKVLGDAQHDDLILTSVRRIREKEKE